MTYHFEYDESLPEDNSMLARIRRGGIRDVTQVSCERCGSKMDAAMVFHYRLCDHCSSIPVVLFVDKP